MQIKRMDPKLLVPHPLNQKMFGPTQRDEQLIAYLQDNSVGMTSPIIVIPGGRKSSDGEDLPALTIVVGHRRTFNAIEAGMETVPVVVNDELVDANDIELALLCDNDPRARRQMDKMQCIRLYVEIKKRIEIQRANGVAISGRKREIAAEAVGMSDKTARDGEQVVKKIDEMREEGREEEAQEIEQTLEKSVSAAKRAIDQMPGLPVTNPDLRELQQEEVVAEKPKKKRTAEQVPVDKRPEKHARFTHPDIQEFEKVTSILTKFSLGVASLADEKKAGVTPEVNVIMPLISEIKEAMASWKNSHLSKLRRRISVHGTQSKEPPSN